MGTHPNHTRGILKMEPQIILQTPTSDFVNATPRSIYDYVETQFLTVDRNLLQKNDLTIEDIHLMDKIYMQSSALPYFLTRVSARKLMVVENPGIQKENRAVSMKNALGNTNSLQLHDVSVNNVNKTNFSPYNDQRLNNDKSFSTPNKQNNFTMNNGSAFKSTNNHSNQLKQHAGTNTASIKTVNGEISSSSGDEWSTRSSEGSGSRRTPNVKNNTHVPGNVSNSKEPLQLENNRQEKINKPKDLLSKISNIRHNAQVAPTSSVVDPVVTSKNSRNVTNAKDIVTPHVPSTQETNTASTITRATTPSAADPVVTSKNNKYVTNAKDVVKPNLASTQETNTASAITRESKMVSVISPIEKKTAPVTVTPSMTGPAVIGREAISTPTMDGGKSYDVVFGDFVNGIYLVIKQDNMRNVEDLHNQLKNERLHTWSKECGEKKVVIVLNGKYYRGIIVQNQVPELKGPSCIKLVDIGCYQGFDPNHSSNIHLLPEKFKSVKPLAFPVQTVHSEPIPRNTLVTIVETGEINEKVKSVTVQKVHPKPIKSTNEIIEPSSSSSQEHQPVSKPSVQSVVQSHQVSGMIHSTLPPNVPVKVIWLQRDEMSEDIHLVQDVNYYTKYDEWQKLSIAQPKLTKMPQVGDLCLKISEDEWCRCRVDSLEPLTVFYVDFGSSDTANSYEELKSIPTDMASDPALAYRIKFYNAENDKMEYTFGDSFEITPIAESGTIYTVLKDNEIRPKLNDTPVKIVQQEKVHPKLSETPMRIEQAEKKTDVNTTVQDYKYGNAAISKNNVEMNKRVEVNFIQDDETHAEHKWLQDVQFADKVQEWEEVMNNFNVPFMPSAIKPGDFCMKLYDDVWCRAKVVSCNPLKLFYVDFGNIETVDSHNDMKHLPQELSEVKPFAMKVQFYHNASNIPTYGNSFFVTPIDTKDDVYVVLRDGEKIELRPSNQTLARYYYKDAAISQPTSLEINKPAEVGFVQNDAVNSLHKWVQDLGLYTYIEGWTSVCNKITNTFQQKPAVGEFCVHFYEESWCRGQVTQVDPLTVFYIDYGNKELISKLEELKPLPAELSVVKPLAHKIQFLHKKSAEMSYNFGDSFKITPVETKDSAVVVLKDDEVVDDVKSCVYKSPVVKLELKKPVEAAWVQDDEFDKQYTWVQDLSHIEQTEVFVTELTKFPGTCTQVPPVGFLCGKIYEDIWSRAKVVATNPLTIFYIDYGNTEEVKNLNELKPLPDNIAKFPGFAYRIRFEKQKPDLSFGEQFTFTPISFVDNVYIASM